ncbi:MAG: protein DA1 [Lentisphaerae bacterium]|nr:protein DA1 [Lentisphaerota bacterium]
MNKKILLFFIFSFTAIMLNAGNKECSTCGRSGNLRIFFGKEFFCSKKCIPEKFYCSICGELPKGKYHYFTDLNGRTHHYCHPCFQNNPRCSACNRPHESNSANSICQDCKNGMITYNKAWSIMQKLRRELAADYGYDAKHKISLKLVDKNTMVRTSGSKSAIGYTQYKIRYKTHKNKRGATRTTDIRHECNIFLLKTLNEKKAHAVLVHELTHDYLFHHLGKPVNSKVNEGICEAMAGAWLMKHGETELFEQMKKNPDPTYGAGFRSLYPQLQRYGFKNMLERNRNAFKPFIRKR